MITILASSGSHEKEEKNRTHKGPSAKLATKTSQKQTYRAITFQTKGWGISRI